MALVSSMPTPRGKGRKGVSALREMCGTCHFAKGALTERPPGAGAPTGSPRRGEVSESLVIHHLFFLKVIGTSFGLKELPLSESVLYSGKPMPGAGTPTRLPPGRNFESFVVHLFLFFF